MAVDCTGSRRELDKQIAIQKMMKDVTPATSEIVIYEILKTAQHEKFKQILEIVKE